MHSFLRSTCLSVLIFCAASVSACSGPGRHRPPPEMQGNPGQQLVVPAGILFASFDRDGDYVISNQEFESGVAEAFTRADADHSSALSLLEYQTWAAKALGSPNALPVWVSIDRDGDSTITASEFRTSFLELAEEDGLNSPSGMTIAKLTSDMPIMMRGGPGGKRPRGFGPQGGGQGPEGPI